MNVSLYQILRGGLTQLTMETSCSAHGDAQLDIALFTYEPMNHRGGKIDLDLPGPSE